MRAHIMCMAPYNRATLTNNKNDVTLYCQYVQGHSTESGHSWLQIYDNDMAEIERQDEALRRTTAKVVDKTPTGPDALIEDFIAGIEAGEYDVYLEAILTAGHQRKLEKRGVRTLDRMRGRRR